MDGMITHPNGATVTRIDTRRRRTERDHDAEIAANRSRYDDAMLKDDAPSLRIAPLRRPSVIRLSASLLVRFARAVRRLPLIVRISALIRRISL